MMNHEVILFDGVCNLCNGAIQFIIKKDKKNIFKFGTLQSESGKKIINTNKNISNIDSVLLITNTNVFYKSTAIIKISQKLGFPYNLLIVTILLPVKLRDKIYDIIAKNRYKWFGKKTNCLVPTPQLKKRFLEY